MRKVTQDAAAAFLAGREGSFANTRVGLVSVQLHGSTIARLSPDRRTIVVTLAGWPTVTTRERVNGLLAAFCDDCPTVTTGDGYSYNPRPGFYQHKGEQYLGYTGGRIDGASPNAWYTLNRRGELVP